MGTSQCPFIPGANEAVASGPSPSGKTAKLKSDKVISDNFYKILGISRNMLENFMTFHILVFSGILS